MAKFTLRTFPHAHGDKTQVLDTVVVKPEEVFTPGYTLVVDGQVLKDWDDLIEMCSRNPEPEVWKFKPIVGG